VTGGVTTLYIGAHQERELPAGVVTNYIFAGNQRIAKKVDSVRHYFHQDHLGSATQTSDSNGDVAETTEYLPFGAMRVHSGTVVSNYKFTDQELDQSTGLYNYDARLYDPLIGRFISADTVVPDWYNPQALNRYSYCYNNPLIYTDPTGHLGDALADALGYQANDDSMYGPEGWASEAWVVDTERDILVFNGKETKVLDGKLQPIESWKSKSGAKGTTPADQHIEWKGPIPEGKYFADPEKTDYFHWYDPRDWDWWGARSREAWGNIRTPLDPAPGNDLQGRSGGYFFHGGTCWGSGGCIDLGPNNEDFHSWLETNNTPVEVYVDYGNWSGKQIYNRD